MRYPSTVNIANIERAIKRKGFSEPYHKVTFDLTEAASEDAFSKKQIEALWERVKPSDFSVE